MLRYFKNVPSSLRLQCQTHCTKKSEKFLNIRLHLQLFISCQNMTFPKSKHFDKEPLFINFHRLDAKKEEMKCYFRKQIYTASKSGINHI